MTIHTYIGYSDSQKKNVRPHGEDLIIGFTGFYDELTGNKLIIIELNPLSTSEVNFYNKWHLLIKLGTRKV